MLSLPDVALFLAVTCIPGIAAAPAPLNIAADLDALATKIDVALSGYAPVKVACPSTPLIRPAECLSANETAYIGKRQSIANTGLAAWLKKTNSAFKTTTLPSLGLTSSGGGYRALLNGAGVIQGLDGRDSDVGTSGLYQGLVYEAGLSGGGWLLSSIIGNNWPTVTSLKTGLWETAFEEGLALPDGALAALALTAVVDDIAAKQAAGYPVTIVDAWGRLLSYQLLYGLDGGVADQLSSVTSYSNFTSHNVPYPIITSRGVNTFDGQCYPQANATQYEFHPYEFGSWDAGVKAFTQTKYLGSSLTDGAPTVAGVCVTNYDNLGYVLGTSSDVFNAACEIIEPSNSTADTAGALEELLVEADHTPALTDLYALYPNPFHGYAGSPLVSSQTTLDLADGGEGQDAQGQNNPIWPFIQDARNVSVLIVNDNSADTTDNFPNGTEIYETYLEAMDQGLTKMPVIPPVSTFIDEGLNKHAVFFGCHDTSVLTIVWLPNVAYSYASNTSTEQLIYTKAETDGIIGNGVNIATQNGTAGWPTCLGCAIQKKTGTKLPSACTACFKEYCYTS